MLKWEPKLTRALGKSHDINPITVVEFCKHFHPSVYVFVCASSGGLFCGTIEELLIYADLIDKVYRKKAYTVWYNSLQELKRLEAITDIGKEMSKAEIRLQQLEIDLMEAKEEEREVKHSGNKKAIEKAEQIVASIETSIRSVNGRIKMLKNAPRRIEVLREYKQFHPEPEYQKPILKMITSKFYSRHLPDEPPMWMIVTDSNQNGDVWLLSEMPGLLEEYRKEFET